MFDINNAGDRLGMGLKQRGREGREQFIQDDAEEYSRLRLENPSIGLYGPARMASGRRMQTVAPDPQWDGYFQALHENGVDRVADNSVGVRKGMWRPSMSSLLGEQTDARQSAMERRTGTGRHRESHDTFTKRYGR